MQTQTQTAIHFRNLILNLPKMVSTPSTKLTLNNMGLSLLQTPLLLYQKNRRYTYFLLSPQL